MATGYRLPKGEIKPITRDHFPIGKPVVIESIIDGGVGWDFDAPLHIMRPFHLYGEVGSICGVEIERRIEDLLIDLDCGTKRKSDPSLWPYENWRYLDGLFLRTRRGVARRDVTYFRSTVVVKSWAKDDDGCVDYSCVTERLSESGKFVREKIGT